MRKNEIEGETKKAKTLPHKGYGSNNCTQQEQCLQQEGYLKEQIMAMNNDEDIGDRQ